jgi:hypothetical protein
MSCPCWPYDAYSALVSVSDDTETQASKTVKKLSELNAYIIVEAARQDDRQLNFQDELKAFKDSENQKAQRIVVEIAKTRAKAAYNACKVHGKCLQMAIIGKSKLECASASDTFVQVMSRTVKDSPDSVAQLERLAKMDDDYSDLMNISSFDITVGATLADADDDDFENFLKKENEKQQQSTTIDPAAAASIKACINT